MAWTFDERRAQLRHGRRAGGVSLPADLVVARARAAATCRPSPRSSAPATRPTASGRRPGWEPPPPGRELDRWRGRVTDGSWWTRVAVEPGGRVVGLVCFTQAVERRPAGPAPPCGVEPIPGRAHVSAMFTHPDRWREGIATALLDEAEAAMRAERLRARCSSGRRGGRRRGASTRRPAGATTAAAVARRPLAADRRVRQGAVSDRSASTSARSATRATRSPCSRSARRSSPAATPSRCRPGGAGASPPRRPG